MGCKTNMFENVKNEFAFPHYTVKDYCYTNSASAALNKWLEIACPSTLCCT
jgi:hypothetical protein